MLEDLPCTPPRIQDHLDPGSAYAPILVPPTDNLLTEWGPSWAGCSWRNMVDMDYAEAATGLSGPGTGTRP